MTDSQTICARCVSDTTIPDIRFDDKGECNFCRIHDTLVKTFPLDDRGRENLDRLVRKIKAAGKDRKYDCVVGISGGTDSTYTLYLARQLGLRPLAVHLNNTWNTDIAAENTKKAVGKLEVDLQEIHCDWDEFRRLQVAFLKASVPDAEIPTDVAIHAILHKVAAEEGIRFVLNGHSFRTEGIAPIGWTYMDGRYINSVYGIYGNGKLKHFPNLTMSRFAYYTFIKRIKAVAFLNYFDYSKENARKILEKELDWTYYGGHHFESIYTRFIIVRLLLRKFGIDKRKINFSAHIRSGFMTRDEALEKLRETPSIEEKDVKYCLDRLGITDGEFEEIMRAEPKNFHDYKTYYSLLKAARPLIKAACRLNLISPVLYLKFFS